MSANLADELESFDQKLEGNLGTNVHGMAGKFKFKMTRGIQFVKCLSGKRELNEARLCMWQKRGLREQSAVFMSFSVVPTHPVFILTAG